MTRIAPPTPAFCPTCGTQLAVGLLACPACGTLLYADRLKQLAAEASQHQSANHLSDALRLWREALELLPPGSQQHQAITATVAALSQHVDAGQGTPAPAGPAAGRRWGPLGAIGAAVIFVLTKAKLILLGLGNLPTLLSMFASLGVYWSVWGWKFALGLVASIYVHEMGHVVALRRFGFRASAPMFIPGLGAVIRLKQHPADPREDARIGLAGPIYGLAAALVCTGVWLATQSHAWGAIAQVGAWINLFNLTPFGPLDGGRGFRALSRTQSWILVATCGFMWWYTTEGMVALVTIVAIIRALAKPKDTPGDRTAFLQYLLLVVSLSLLTELPIRPTR